MKHGKWVLKVAPINNVVVRVKDLHIKLALIMSETVWDELEELPGNLVEPVKYVPIHVLLAPIMINEFEHCISQWCVNPIAETYVNFKIPNPELWDRMWLQNPAAYSLYNINDSMIRNNEQANFPNSLDPDAAQYDSSLITYDGRRARALLYYAYIPFD